MGLVAGCGHPSSVELTGVEFKNEVQLQQAGYVTKLHQEVNIGDEKIVIQKVAFDRDSLTFAYKGETVPAMGDLFNIEGQERTKSQKLTQLVTTPSFGATVGSDYQVVVVPHNLELVNQKITVELNINGRDNKFTINFPGDVINSSTAEVMTNKNGNVVKDTTNASYKVIVGVGYITVESKDDSDFIVEDEKKQRIQQSFKGSTTGESLTVYEPLPLPRREPSIKVDPAQKVVIVSVK